MSARQALEACEESDPVDFVFVTGKPIAPEYRQAYSEAQLKWLEQWSPRDGAWIN